MNLDEAKFKISMWLFSIYWKIGYLLFDEIRDIESDLKLKEWM